MNPHNICRSLGLSQSRDIAISGEMTIELNRMSLCEEILEFFLIIITDKGERSGGLAQGLSQRDK